MRISKRWLVGLIFLAGACDPTAIVTEGGKQDGEAKAGAAKAGEKAEADAGAEAGDKAEAEAGAGDKAEAQAGEKAEVAQAEVSLDGCLAECEGKDLSEDDLATCRLRCKNVAGQAGDEHPMIGAYHACFDECATKGPDNRATCQKNCAASVTAGTGDPAKSDCPRACAETFGSCLSPCEDKSSPDDKATCTKQCDVDAAKCVDACA